MTLQKGIINGHPTFVDSEDINTPIVNLAEEGGDILAHSSATIAIRRPTHIVNTVADLYNISDTHIIHGQTYQTLGYYSETGVGGNTYIYDSSSINTIDSGFVLNGPGGIGRYLAIDRSIANFDQFGITGNQDITIILKNLSNNIQNNTLNILLPSKPMTLYSDNVSITGLRNLSIETQGDVTIQQLTDNGNNDMWEFHGCQNANIGHINFVGYKNINDYTATNSFLINIQGLNKANPGGIIRSRANFFNTTNGGLGINGLENENQAYDIIDVEGNYEDSRLSIGASSLFTKVKANITDPFGYAFAQGMTASRGFFLGRSENYDVKLNLRYGKATWFTAATIGNGTIDVEAQRLGYDISGNNLGSIPATLVGIGKIDTAANELGRVTHKVRATDCSEHVTQAVNNESSPGPTNRCLTIDPHVPTMQIKLWDVNNEGSKECYGNSLYGGISKSVGAGVHSNINNHTTTRLTINRMTQPIPTLYANGVIVKDVFIEGGEETLQGILIHGGTLGTRFDDVTIQKKTIYINNQDSLRTTALFRHINSSRDCYIDCNDYTNVKLGFYDCDDLDFSDVPKTSQPYVCLDAVFPIEATGNFYHKHDLNLDFAFDVFGNYIIPKRFSGSSTYLLGAEIQTTTEYDIVTGKGSYVFACSSTNNLGSILWDVGTSDCTIEGELTLVDGGSKRTGFLVAADHDNNGLWCGLNYDTDTIEMRSYNYGSISASAVIPGGIDYDKPYILKVEFNGNNGVCSGFINGTGLVTTTRASYINRTHFGIKHFDKFVSGYNEQLGPKYTYIDIYPRTETGLYPGALKSGNNLVGTGSPEGVIFGGIGAMYRRTDGAIGSTLYIKESGNNNTGWVAK